MAQAQRPRCGALTRRAVEESVETTQGSHGNNDPSLINGVIFVTLWTEDWEVTVTLSYMLSHATTSGWNLQGDRKGINDRLRSVRKLHARGLIDREIAGDIGIHPASVSRLRTRQGLTANGPKRRRRLTSTWANATRFHITDEDLEAVFGKRDPPQPLVERIERLRLDGTTIAESFGDWTPPGQSLKWSPAQAMLLWLLGLNDRQIADHQGVSRETISRWRRKAGLEKNGTPGPQTNRAPATWINVRCHRCKYLWSYKGPLPRATCPRCKTTVTLQKNRTAPPSSTPR